MPVSIALAAAHEAKGRVVDTVGKPIAGAEIVPVIFERSHAQRQSNDYLRLTPALAGPLAATTAKDGSFALKGIPAGCEVHATLSAQGFGAPRVSWDSKRPVTITLDGRLGRVDGRLITSDAKELPAPLEPVIRPSSPPDEHAGGSFELVYLKIIKVGGDGRFRFDQLPPGRYTISVNDDPDSGYQSDGTAEVEIRPMLRFPA